MPMLFYSQTIRYHREKVTYQPVTNLSLQPLKLGIGVFIQGGC